MSAYLGAFIEGMATLLCRLASRTIADLGIRHATFIDSFVGTSLVVAGNGLFSYFLSFIFIVFAFFRFQIVLANWTMVNHLNDETNTIIGTVGTNEPTTFSKHSNTHTHKYNRNIP